MTRRVLTAVVLAGLSLFLTSATKADNLHLCDINQWTTCNAGSVIPTSTTAAFVFGTSHTNDTLNLVILNPLADGSGNFASGSNLWTVLGISPGQVSDVLQHS